VIRDATARNVVMDQPDLFMISDFAKMDHPAILHFGFRAILQYISTSSTTNERSKSKIGANTLHQHSPVRTTRGGRESCVVEASPDNMNKHTDDQSSPTFPPATSEANFEFSGHLPLPSTGLLHQARGNLKDDGNEDKVEAPIPVRKFWKKPIDMPKRPMSSYNIFYRMERERLIEGGRLHSYTSEDVNQFVAQQQIKDECPKPKRKHRRTHGKISFTELARVIASNWRNMDEASKAPFIERAVIEKKAYTTAIAAWNKAKNPKAVGETEGKTEEKYVNLPVQENELALECSNTYDQDRNYELFSDAETDSSPSITARKQKGRSVGTHNIKSNDTDLYDLELFQNSRPEREALDRIHAGLTFDSIHEHDDTFSAGGTLNRSRSLSDITDYENLTLQYPRTTGQRNIPFVGQQIPSMNTLIGSNNLNRSRLEIRNIPFDGNQMPSMNIPFGSNNLSHNTNFLRQEITANRIQQIPVPPQGVHISTENISNQYAGQQIQSFLHGDEPFSHSSSGQPNFQIFDPMQQNIPVGSFTGTNDLFNLHSTISDHSRLNRSTHLLQSPQANSLATLLHIRDQSMVAAPYSSIGPIIRNDVTGVPQHMHHQQERPVDFVTSSEDVQVGYTLQSETIARSYQTRLFPSTQQLLPQISDDRNFNLQHESYPVTHHNRNFETLLPQVQRYNDSSAARQSIIFQQLNDNRTLAGNVQQVTHPYHQINDNDVINQSEAMLQVAQQQQQQQQQQYTQTINNNSRYTSNDNGAPTALNQQPSDLTQAHEHEHQRRDHQNNQSNDESPLWD
jgi:Ubiquitin-activating enzyme E1 four-helix bundle/HMG (high mobility group) box